MSPIEGFTRHLFLGFTVIQCKSSATVSCLRSIQSLCREARTKLSRRPWRVDTFDALAHKWLGASSPDSLSEPAAVPRSPFRRVIMFVDNAGKAAQH